MSGTTAVSQPVQGSLARGSQWRKWDLHLHGPTAVFNNGFGDPKDQATWEHYITALGRLCTSSATLL